MRTVSRTPIVSICIRASRGDFLAEAISSALEQNFGPLEVVVSDDAGHLQGVAAQFDDPRVRYCANEGPRGVTQNALHALRNAKGQFIGLLDDDDLLLPGFVSRVVDEFHRDATLGVVFTNHLFERNGRRRPRRSPVPAGRHESFLRDVLVHNPIPASAALMRREAWEDGERAVPLCADAPPDFVLWVRTAAAGWPFFYIDEPLMVYREHPGQVTHREEFVRSRMIRAWELFRFQDPECERLRRHGLAKALRAHATTQLKLGSMSAAAVDLARAAEVDEHPEGFRAKLIRLLANHPPAARAATTAWRWYRHLQLSFRSLRPAPRSGFQRHEGDVA